MVGDLQINGLNRIFKVVSRWESIILIEFGQRKGILHLSFMYMPMA